MSMTHSSPPRHRAGLILLTAVNLMQSFKNDADGAITHEQFVNEHGDIVSGATTIEKHAGMSHIKCSSENTALGTAAFSTRLVFVLTVKMLVCISVCISLSIPQESRTPSTAFLPPDTDLISSAQLWYSRKDTICILQAPPTMCRQSKRRTTLSSTALLSSYHPLMDR